MGVQMDKTVEHAGQHFRIILYAAYNAFGLVGSEMNGIAVLNEDLRNVVLDGEACIDSGYFGASDRQKARFEEIVKMDWPAFRTWVNSHKRNRYEI